jgi:predicted transposase/invertase (TIGR01784 family)
MSGIFADPKTDIIFKRIFGTKARKHLLIQLLDAMLQLKGDRRIKDLSFLSPEQVPEKAEMKLSIVDVKCKDERGIEYVVEMQVVHVGAFEQRVVYNASKAYAQDLPSGGQYADLDDVVAVTICDFTLWPDSAEPDSRNVPMLSHWHMQEQSSGTLGLPQIKYVFLELPKYDAGPHPQSMLDKWAHFFRETEDLDVIPPELAEEPFLEAFEVARRALFTAFETTAYERAKIAEQDARGAINRGREEGREEGELSALRG